MTQWLGAVWYTGLGVPDPELGSDSDHYLDSVSATVYTKTLGLWQASFVLRGSQGVPGQGFVDSGTEGQLLFRSVSEYSNQFQSVTSSRIQAALGGTPLESESDTLASVSSRGAATGQSISVTNTTVSVSTQTGAVRVQGGVGVGQTARAAVFAGTLTGPVTGSVTGAVYGNATGNLTSGTIEGYVLGDLTGTAASVLGGIYTTGNYVNPDWLTITAAKVGASAVAISGSYTSLSNQPAQYTLPTATSSVLGGVTIDTDSIQISGSGQISGIYSGYTLPAASTVLLGGVRPDNTSITITNGVISGPNYVLPALTGTTRGGVIVNTASGLTLSNVDQLGYAGTAPLASTTVFGRSRGDQISILNRDLSPNLQTLTPVPSRNKSIRTKGSAVGRQTLLNTDQVTQAKGSYSTQPPTFQLQGGSTIQEIIGWSRDSVNFVARQSSPANIMNVLFYDKESVSTLQTYTSTDSEMINCAFDGYRYVYGTTSSGTRIRTYTVVGGENFTYNSGFDVNLPTGTNTFYKLAVDPTNTYLYLFCVATVGGAFRVYSYSIYKATDITHGNINASTNGFTILNHAYNNTVKDVVFHPTLPYVYISISLSPTIHVYHIDYANNGLWVYQESRTTLLINVEHLVIHPSGQCLYCVGPSESSLERIGLDQLTGLSTGAGTSTATTFAVKSCQVCPSGTRIYLAGDIRIATYNLNPQTGDIWGFSSQSAPLPVNISRLHISPNGIFLIVYSSVYQNYTLVSLAVRDQGIITTGNLIVGSKLDPYTYRGRYHTGSGIESRYLQVQEALGYLPLQSETGYNQGSDALHVNNVSTLVLTDFTEGAQGVTRDAARDRVPGMAIDPTGRMVVIGANDTFFHVYRIDDKLGTINESTTISTGNGSTSNPVFHPTSDVMFYAARPGTNHYIYGMQVLRTSVTAPSNYDTTLSPYSFTFAGISNADQSVFRLLVDPTGRYMVGLGNDQANDGLIRIFTMQPGANAALTSLTSLDLGNTIIRNLVFLPSGNIFFITRGNQIDRYFLDTNNLRLEQTQIVAGSSLRAMAIDPIGRWLYVFDNTSVQLKIYSIDALDNSIVEVTSISTSVTYEWLTIDPTGTTLIGCVNGTAARLDLYAINQLNGRVYANTQRIYSSAQIGDTSTVLLLRNLSNPTWDITRNRLFLNYYNESTTVTRLLSFSLDTTTLGMATIPYVYTQGIQYGVNQTLGVVLNTTTYQLVFPCHQTNVYYFDCTNTGNTTTITMLFDRIYMPSTLRTHQNLTLYIANNTNQTINLSTSAQIYAITSLDTDLANQFAITMNLGTTATIPYGYSRIEFDIFNEQGSRSIFGRFYL